MDKSCIIDELSVQARELSSYHEDCMGSEIESKFKQKITGLDYILIYGAIVIVTILFLIILIIGANTTWYINLNKGSISNWLIIVLWIIAGSISYIGLFLLWGNIKSTELSINLNVAILFLVSIFLALGWIAIFYYNQNIGLSFWLALVLFIYEFWLFMHIWYINPIAAMFFTPILALYIYLMYFTAHIASVNNIPM